MFVCFCWRVYMNKKWLCVFSFIFLLFSAIAKDKGSLTVYGSCEEAYLTAVCTAFEQATGIKTNFQRLSSGEVITKIEMENGKPSADVWFGGTTDPYNEAARKGLLYAYNAKNAKNLISQKYKSPDNYWYGIYHGVLGFFWNKDELNRLNLTPPKDWDDLTNPKYKGLISFGNPSTSGTGRLIINTIVQMKGHDNALSYFKALDKNIAQYPKAGAGPSKMVPTGEVVIGIGFLHDALFQVVDNGYHNIAMTSPTSGTSYEIGATAIFKGAKNIKNAKAFIEFALTPACVNLAQDNGSYQFLVIKNGKPVSVAVAAGLDKVQTINYDFTDAAKNSERYIQDFYSVIQNDDRVKTK